MPGRTRLAAIVAATAALTFAGSGIAGAGLDGEPPPTMEISSEVVELLETLTFGNTPNEFSTCGSDDGDNDNEILQEIADLVQWRIVDADSGEFVGFGEAVADDEGNWDSFWPVRDVAPGTYVLEAFCFAAEDEGNEVAAQQEATFEYEPRIFEVVAPDVVLPPDEPAEPVETAPTFTG